jgi:hypothetical protein
VAGQLGYCGLDRQRRPLRGDEIRPCWEAADATSINVPALPGIGPVWPLEIGDGRTTVRSREFVEVASGPEEIPTPEPIVLSPTAPGELRWSLWGDTET